MMSYSEISTCHKGSEFTAWVDVSSVFTVAGARGMLGASGFTVGQTMRFSCLWELSCLECCVVQGHSQYMKV